MTIISNPFALACRQLLPKYTISTLQSTDIVDNQDSYGWIWKFTRFLLTQNAVLCYEVCSMRLALQSLFFAICVAKLRIFREVFKPLFRRCD